MSRSGVEDKPPWSAVPSEAKERVAAVLGSRVVSGNRVWGGYGPSPTYRLRLENGQKAFFKAVWQGSNEFQLRAHDRELKVYRDLRSVIQGWSPVFIAEFDLADWRVMLLEDLGRQSAPPWTLAGVRAAVHGLAEFHESTSEVPLPGWLRPLSDVIGPQHILWTRPAGHVDYDRLCVAAGVRAGEARQWLERHLEKLTAEVVGYYGRSGRRSLLHMDVRSDNLRLVEGALKLFDWPHVAVGGPEFDVVGFAQSVEVDKGPQASQVFEMYRRRFHLEEEAVTGAVAAISGFFANQVWQPAIPLLPRLRAFQVAQLRVTLAWTAERLGLPRPDWVSSIEPTEYFR